MTFLCGVSKKWAMEYFCRLPIISSSMGTWFSPPRPRPQQLKVLVPVHEYWDLNSCAIYRPFSYLPVSRKFIENILSVLGSPLSLKNTIWLSISCLAFGRYTTSSCFIFGLKRKLRNKHSAAIFCDLGKALNTGTHSILKKKKRKKCYFAMNNAS